MTFPPIAPGDVRFLPVDDMPNVPSSTEHPAFPVNDPGQQSPDAFPNEQAALKPIEVVAQAVQIDRVMDEVESVESLLRKEAASGWRAQHVARLLIKSYVNHNNHVVAALSMLDGPEDFKVFKDDISRIVDAQQHMSSAIRRILDAQSNAPR